VDIIYLIRILVNSFHKFFCFRITFGFFGFFEFFLLNPLTNFKNALKYILLTAREWLKAKETESNMHH